MLLGLLSPSQSETLHNGRPSVVLKGKVAQLVVDIGGGSIVSFRLHNQPTNPLAFDSSEFDPSEKAILRPLGHFLCLDRWGPVTEAEKQNGMFFHGEASRVKWEIIKPPTSEGDYIQALMTAKLPLAGLEIKRQIQLSSNSASFFVSEQVTNKNLLGRIYNMVQHPTIGPPFLDEDTLVDSNAQKGFMQTSPLPTPEKPVVYWPNALKGTQLIDLRRLLDDSDPNVVSFTFEEHIGWITASSLSEELLIGYLWDTREYPWLNIWRHAKNGKPEARGLEFGTTGLHQPFPVLVEKRQIFDRPIFTYLDTGQTSKRHYLAFLFKIPKDYRGVARVTYEPGKITLHEQGSDPKRTLKMKTGNLPLVIKQTTP